MHLRKRTYSIEEDTLKAFEQAVEAGKRSHVLRDLMREYIAEQEREKLRARIIAAAPLVNDFYREETKAWYPLEEEVYEKSRESRTRGHHPSRVRPSERPRASRSSARARTLSRSH